VGSLENSVLSVFWQSLVGLFSVCLDSLLPPIESIAPKAEISRQVVLHRVY